MLVKIKQKTLVTSLFDFLQTFKLEKQFMKDYKLKKVEDWKNSSFDSEIINKYLEKDLNKLYINIFVDEGEGYFVIHEIQKEIKQISME